MTSSEQDLALAGAGTPSADSGAQALVGRVSGAKDGFAVGDGLTQRYYAPKGEHLPGLGSEGDEVDVSCFIPQLRFESRDGTGSTFLIQASSWERLGKPLVIDVRVTAA